MVVAAPNTGADPKADVFVAAKAGAALEAKAGAVVPAKTDVVVGANAEVVLEPFAWCGYPRLVCAPR